MTNFRVNLPVLVVALAANSASGDDATAFFESSVAPVFQEHCSECHSEAAARNGQLQGSLLLDSLDDWQRGGDSGQVIIPGDAEASLLITALRYQDDALQMPPDDKLPDAVIDNLVSWINAGAVDPRRSTFRIEDLTDFESIRRSHWAYQPLTRPPVPEVDSISAVVGGAWLANPIDRFIAHRLAAAGVTPAEPAQPGVWLRRVYLDLIGLPPTVQQQAEFDRDTSEVGRARVVDQLLASAHYGERWGRHWLDVARYGETRGYEDDESMPFSWLYRDWVIKAFNADLPYDQFVRHQLAGDEIEGSDRDSLIATMLLSIGSYDTQGESDKPSPRSVFGQLDDIVATTSQAFMGITVQCARCHDHKFDPVTQKDYYRLLAAFEPLDIQRVQISREGVDLTPPDVREQNRVHNERLDRQLVPLVEAKERFEITAAAELIEIEKLPGRNDTERLKPDLLKRLITALQTKLADRTKEQLKEHTLFRVGLTADINAMLNEDEARAQQYKQLVKAVTDLEATRAEPIVAFIFPERESPPPTHIRIRGEAENLGDVVQFGLPEVLNWSPSETSEPQPAQSAQKTTRYRTALADWLTGPGRGLTARVMVNRIWLHHFGKGFVENANNLSVSGGQPSHPELLNWLADQLMHNGWKLKPLHRMIVLSQTYAQGISNPESQLLDSLNELYSRWPQHRLDAEVIRDSMLAVSGQLNRQMEGPSVYPEIDRIQNGASSSENWLKSDQRDASRRSVYVFAKRAFQLPELRSMGQPDPALSCEQRVVATTPVQSLLLMNGKFAWQQAKHFAARLRNEVNTMDPQSIVQRAYQLTLGRLPDKSERAWSVQYLSQEVDAQPDRLATFCLIMFNASEFAYQN